MAFHKMLWKTDRADLDVYARVRIRDRRTTDLNVYANVKINDRSNTDLSVETNVKIYNN